MRLARLTLLAIAALLYFACSPSDRKETPAIKSETPATESSATVAGYPLRIGKDFPDIRLTTALGQPQSTRETFQHDGAVFVFLDPACAECSTMVRQWQQRIAAGVVNESQVCGILPASVAVADFYRRKLAIDFPLLADTLLVFSTTYEVRDAPLALVVGKSGIVRDYLNDVHRQVFPDQLQQQLAQ